MKYLTKEDVLEVSHRFGDDVGSICEVFMEHERPTAEKIHKKVGGYGQFVCFVVRDMAEGTDYRWNVPHDLLDEAEKTSFDVWEYINHLQQDR